MAPTSLARWSLAFLACTFCGCASTGLLRFMDSTPRDSSKNPVVQVLAIWQSADGLWEGRTTRGFAGQLCFFTPRSPLPAEVDGTVTVFVFDDQGTTPEEQSQPFHSFEFTPEMWATLRHKGRLGLTYRVFIPYTRKGRHQAQCSLVVRYTPKQGAPVSSEMSNIELAGSKPKSAGASGNADQSGGATAKNGGPQSPETAMQEAFAEFVRKQRAADGDAAGAADHRITAPESLVEAPRKPRKNLAPLSDTDRERIIREAQRHWRDEEGVSTDELFEREEAQSTRTRTARRRAPRSRGVIQAHYETVEEADDAEDNLGPDEELSEDELPRATRRHSAPPRRLPANQEARAIDVSEVDDQDEPEVEIEGAAGQNRQTSAGNVDLMRRPRTEWAESHDNPDGDSRKKMEVTTIALPGRGL